MKRNLFRVLITLCIALICTVTIIPQFNLKDSSAASVVEYYANPAGKIGTTCRPDVRFYASPSTYKGLSISPSNACSYSYNGQNWIVSVKNNISTSPRDITVYGVKNNNQKVKIGIIHQEGIRLVDVNINRTKISALSLNRAEDEIVITCKANFPIYMSEIRNGFVSINGQSPRNNGVGTAPAYGKLNSYKIVVNYPNNITSNGKSTTHILSVSAAGDVKHFQIEQLPLKYEHVKTSFGKTAPFDSITLTSCDNYEAFKCGYSETFKNRIYHGFLSNFTLKVDGSLVNFASYNNIEFDKNELKFFDNIENEFGDGTYINIGDDKVTFNNDMTGFDISFKDSALGFRQTSTYKLVTP